MTSTFFHPTRRTMQFASGKRRSGFTVVEMMVVVAIIAILGAMTIPTFQERITIKQVEEAVAMADMAKRPIAAQWAAKQTFAADNAAVELPIPEKIVGNFVTSMTVKDGVIHIRFGNSAASVLKNKTLSIRPAVVSDAPTVPVAWVCAKAPVPARMTVQGTDQSDIPSTHLPLMCRERTISN